MGSGVSNTPWPNFILTPVKIKFAKPMKKLINSFENTSCQVAHVIVIMILSFLLETEFFGRGAER